MTRGEPQEAWVAYVVVLVVVAAMLLGKYLMARGDKNDVHSTNNKDQIDD
ncbi:MAG: hypothetical protein U9N30_07440 [Campylobacterota bacterium]|nr:hypothetical protein [Campylobacterota bacterium]